MAQTVRHEAIRRLLAGVKGFRARYYERNPESMRDLVAHGQHPDVLLIGCSDSRVDPALLTMAEPGELFVVRNVANLVPPYQPDGSYHGTSAAIEYAVRELKVANILVLGHARCGGIQGLIRLRSGEGLQSDFVAPWVSLAGEACDRYLDEVGADDSGDCATDLRDRPHLVERAAIRGSVENLLTFPWVREGVDAGELQVHGWWFDLDSGDLWAIDPDTKRFERVE
ncbi:carbonic anhydrase [Azospirillum halopraeferens]|uniref:carbonic anhydrase n=1 Tax=Azospirillum halopraeferens TaxID=34010 RepID=UPI00054D09A7|nr:carbonic anhydrase [Azospirillum halopraeferens]